MGKRLDEIAIQKYNMYLTGLSLEGVAKQFNCTRQSIYEIFKSRGFELRKLNKKPSIEFNGFNYTIRKDGYYRKTSKDRSLLHSDIWIFHKGNIPKGSDIHHIDNNKCNNNIENLVMITKEQHGRIHSKQGSEVRYGKKYE